MADSSSRTTTLILLEDANITANFLRKPVLTITVNPAGAGSVLGGGSFVPGSSATLTATAEDGYAFKDWNRGVTGTQNPATVTVNEDMAVTANFEVRKYTVTVEVEGNGNGNVTGDGEYEKGAQVTLTATPTAGHIFLGWKAAGSSYVWPEPETTKSFTVSGDYSYEAIFSPVVNVPDAKLRSILERQIGWYWNYHKQLGVYLNSNPTQLTGAHMELFTQLWIDDSNIASLEGIQHATNLESFHGDEIGVSDLSPLWNLPSLRVLELDWGGRITSINGIEKLTKLERLDLDGQKLTDISPLKNLPNLRHLEIEENHLDLSDPSVQADIKSLRDRGVEVEVELQLPKGRQKTCRERLALLRNRLAANPNDAQANFLYAFELLLNLFEDKGANSLKATVVSAGVSDSITSFVLPDLWQEDDDHDFSLNRNSDLNELSAHFEKAFLPTLATIDMHLARISSGMLISLPQDQTGMEDEMLVDHGDALALRAGLKALSGYIRTLTSYDWSMNAGKADDLDEADAATLETILDIAPTLGSLRTDHSLTQAKQDFQDAVSLYKQASEVVRGRMSVERLINMESEDLEDEAEFRVELDEFLKALDQQAFGREAGEDTVDLSRLFAGNVDVRAMIPKATGDQFATYKVADPTFGGLLPTWDLTRIRQELQDADLLATVPDSELAKELRQYIWSGQPGSANRDINPYDLAWLNWLWLEEENIKDIAGLEHATGLRYLDLEGNKIADITPLVDLPNLQYVDLDWNNLDLSSIETWNAINKMRAKGVKVSIDTQRSKYLQNMSGEMANLKSTLNGNPNDTKANFLYGLHLLLNVFESDSFKNLLISAGMSETFRNFYLDGHRRLRRGPFQTE